MGSIIMAFLSKGKMILGISAALVVMVLIAALLWYRGEAINSKTEVSWLRLHVITLENNLQASEALVKSRAEELKVVGDLFTERDKQYNMLESTVEGLLIKMKDMEHEERAYLDTNIPGAVSAIVREAVKH